MRTRNQLTACLTLFCTYKVFSQNIPLDPTVKTGKLSNGFSYYIKKNTEPKKRALLYLVSKAGSILEDADQQGLAHFIEHMQFNGTKHFPKNELINYLEKAGVKFGSDLNAYTSFDETVYQLPIPVDKKNIFDTAMLIMRDWAQDALLQTEEIDKERGVILEEKRLSKGASERLKQQYLPLLLNRSRYSNRLPIGTDEVLNNFDPSTLRRFYKEWYRPDLQALIVVGDIDPGGVEKQVKKLFGNLKKSSKSKKRITYPITLTGNKQFISLTDPELSSTRVQLIVKHPATGLRTVKDYYHLLLRNLFNQMLAERYRALSQQDSCPFIQATAGIVDFMAGLDVFSINVTTKPGATEKGFKSVLRETERVKRAGFLATELQRAKKNYLTNLNSLLKEKDKTPSIQFVKAFQKNFLEGQAAPSIEVQHKLLTGMLDTVTLQAVNAFASRYIKDTDRDILLLAPESEKNKLPDETTMNSWIAAIQKQQFEAYTDNVPDTALLAVLPTPGKVTSEKNDPTLGITELILNNGVKVILKPTDFKADEIIFQSFSPGGTSLYDEKDYQSAASAALIMNNCGLGDFNAVQLTKILNGKKLGVNAYISDRFEGISGTTSPDDLETALQLIHLYFTKPRKDSVIFNNIIENSRVALANRYNNPVNIFKDTMNFVLGGYHPRSSPSSLQKLETVNLDRVYDIFRDRFADAGDFTFVFTGSFDVILMRPLLEQYLGSLPSSGIKEQTTGLGMRIPAGQINKTVIKGQENKATVRMVYSGDFIFNSVNTQTLNALSTILQIKLTERLREKEGGTYSPLVQHREVKYPSARFGLTIEFGCSPDNTEKLIKAVEEEITQLKQQGVDIVYIQKYVHQMDQAYELEIKNNNVWAGYLQFQYQNNEDLHEILYFKDRLKLINKKIISDAAITFLNGQNKIIFTLLPEIK